MLDAVSAPLVDAVGSLATEMRDHLKTRNSQYYFFIKKGLITGGDTIDLTCMCGTSKTWPPPHDPSALYCRACGSHFNLLEVEGDGGYVITSAGPIRIIGSDAPDFKDLPYEEQLRLMKDVEHLTSKKRT